MPECLLVWSRARPAHRGFSGLEWPALSSEYYGRRIRPVAAEPLSFLKAVPDSLADGGILDCFVTSRKLPKQPSTASLIFKKRRKRVPKVFFR